MRMLASQNTLGRDFGKSSRRAEKRRETPEKTAADKQKSYHVLVQVAK